MWLVRLALRRPYTFVVMALLIVLLGAVTIRRMPTDILPEIDIPVVSVVWSYAGLPPEEMEKRVVSNFERFLITTVNDIEHTESQSLTGVAVIKVFFHPGAKIEAATAQITAASQTAVRSLPPGATPPLILRYSASNAPVLQLPLESSDLSEQELFDYGVNYVPPHVLASAEEGEKLSALDYLAAEGARAELATRMAEYHRRFDLLITPTIAEPAPRLDAPPAPRDGSRSLTRSA